MRSTYVSPDTPRWSPKTEQDLRDAIGHDLLAETHYLELKRELPPPGRSTNREHARDLASFAVDGGTLIIGIEEDKKTGRFRLAPQPLDGLRERIESIARDVPDPPLYVVTTRIESEADATKGYLVVHVPPSPVAPHMVDQRYMGRGDTRKHTLSDAEVLRLHERRSNSELDALALLDEEFERDPVPPNLREQSHLFLLAEPLAGRPDMLVHIVSGKGWQDRLTSLGAGADSEETRRALGNSPFAPDMLSAIIPSRRASGAALATDRLSSDRIAGVENVVEVEVRDSGSIRVFMGRLSDKPRDNDQGIFDTGAVLYTRRVLALTLAVADRTGYFGSWALAVGATNLRGRAALRPFGSGPKYSENVYKRSTLASYGDLLERPGTLAYQLIGQLLRALGVRESWALALSDPPLSDATKQD